VQVQTGSTQAPDSIIRTTSPVTVRCRYKGKNGAPCDSRDTLKRCYKKRLRTEAGRYFVCSEPTRRGGVWGARHDRRCASLLLGYVGVGGCTARSVCATKSRHRARSSMCEFAAGLREVGGCTARSVCATESRRRSDSAEDGGAAGPGPVLGLSGQAGLDGIVLNVGADGVELFGRADPMVEGLVLPEMLLSQGED